jgi:hypothetical protein
MAKFTSSGATMVSDAAIASADDYVPVTPDGEPLEGGPCRAILCDEDGFLNLTTIGGDERESVFVLKGYNPIKAAAIDLPTTGDAPNAVWALY